MLPFEKRFKLTGIPSFAFLEEGQVALGRALERLGRDQGLDFVDSCLTIPSICKNGHEFEYRLLSSHREDDIIYKIQFEHFRKNNTLRILSAMPAEQAMPLVNFIVNEFLLTKLAEDVSGRHYDEEETLKWMERTWPSEVKPAFDELHGILDGTIKLPKDEASRRFLANRPNGDVEWNPILKYIKASSSKKISNCLRLLPEKEQFVREIIDAYFTEWQQFAGACVPIFKSLGIQLRERFCCCRELWMHYCNVGHFDHNENMRSELKDSVKALHQALNAIASDVIEHNTIEKALRLKQKSKTIPLLERIAKHVKAALADKNECGQLFKSPNFTQDTNELFGGTFSENYHMSAREAEMAAQLWMKIRMDMQEYLERFESTKEIRHFEDDLNDKDCYFITEPTADDPSRYQLAPLPAKMLSAACYRARNLDLKLRRDGAAKGTPSCGRVPALSPRKEHVLNESKITCWLHDRAFDLLGLTEAQRRAAMKRDFTGRKIAAATRVREATVGKIVSLRARSLGGGTLNESAAQLYYLICNDPDLFDLFAEIERRHKPPRRNKDVNEHARRLKTEIEAELRRR